MHDKGVLHQQIHVHMIFCLISSINYENLVLIP